MIFYSQGSRDTTTLVFNKTLLLYFVTITVLVAFLKNMWVWMHLSYWWWLSQSDISVMGSVRSSLPIISSSTLQILCSVLCSMQCRLVSVCIAGAAPQTIAIIFIWYNHFFFLFLGLINIYTHLQKIKTCSQFQYLSQLELLVSLSISSVNNKPSKICKSWFYLFLVNEWLFFFLCLCLTFKHAGSVL